MNLSTLNLKQSLKVHRVHSNESTLPNVLGDGYLYKHSHFFRALRDHLLGGGVKFVVKDSKLLDYYKSLPLFFLNDILETRTIPCKNTVEPLIHLSEKYNLDIPWIEMSPMNPITHESMHLVVNDFFGGSVPDYSKVEDANELTCQMLAGEASANTMENLIANEKFNTDYSTFAVYNLYLKPIFENSIRLKFLAELYSEEIVFKFMFYSYVLSNYHYNATLPDENMLPNLISYLGIKVNAYSNKLFHRTLKDAFLLNRMFTSNTTANYFRMINGKDELNQIYDFDLNHYMYVKNEFEPLVNHLIGVLKISSSGFSTKKVVGE